MPVSSVVMGEQQNEDVVNRVEAEAVDDVDIDDAAAAAEASVWRQSSTPPPSSQLNASPLEPPENVGGGGGGGIELSTTVQPVRAVEDAASAPADVPTPATSHSRQSYEDNSSANVTSGRPMEEEASYHHHHQQQQQHHHHHNVHHQHAQMMASNVQLSVNQTALEYPWFNGQHASVMEPVAINPETGFTTVLVDATAVTASGGAYHQHHHPHHHHHPHAVPVAPPAWMPPHHHSMPPLHFLHPHAYHDHMATAEFHHGGGGGGGGGGNYMGQYGTVDYHHHESVVGPMYDPSLHLSIQHAATAYGQGGQKMSSSSSSSSAANGGQRSQHNQPPHRCNSRGSSVSPKRPARTTSQNHNNNNNSSSSNSNRPANNGNNTGRYTPSPSTSTGSRGSSPGQTAPCMSSAVPPPPPAVLAHGPTNGGAAPQPPPPPPLTAGQHVVHLHVNPGETVSLQMGGQVQVIQGECPRPLCTLLFTKFFLVYLSITSACVGSWKLCIRDGARNRPCSAVLVVRNKNQLVQVSKFSKNPEKIEK